MLPYALRLLGRRARSVAEIRQALQKKEAEPELIEAVIGELKELKFLNDLEFARSWVRSRDRVSPRGEFRLRQELLEKGIAKDLISQVLAERKEAAGEDEGMSEFELAQQVAETRSRSYSHLPVEARRRRLAGFLQRRGFSIDTISRILKEG